MANFIRHFYNVLENLEVTGKKVRHFDNDPNSGGQKESQKESQVMVTLAVQGSHFVNEWFENFYILSLCK